MPRPEPESGVDVDAPQCFGPFAGERLDVHASLGGEHPEVLADGAIEHHRGIELVRDRKQLLDKHTSDGVTLEIGAEHARRRIARFVGGPAEGNAAALAATSYLD